MSNAHATADVVNQILGAGDQGVIARLRGAKPNQVTELQNYYDALFHPTEASDAAFPLTDRYLVAIRVASFTGSAAVRDWYAALATAAGVASEEIARAGDVAAPWSDDSTLGAAMRHTDLLVARTSEARKADIDALKAAGLSPAGILSLSQTIAFVSYQLRLVAGLRAFGGEA